MPKAASLPKPATGKRLVDNGSTEGANKQRKVLGDVDVNASDASLRKQLNVEYGVNGLNWKTARGGILKGTYRHKEWKKLTKEDIVAILNYQRLQGTKKKKQSSLGGFFKKKNE